MAFSWFMTSGSTRSRLYSKFVGAIGRLSSADAQRFLGLCAGTAIGCGNLPWLEQVRYADAARKGELDASVIQWIPAFAVVPRASITAPHLTLAARGLSERKKTTGGTAQRAG